MNESETIAKYEIMDGSPVRGEIIPIRLYLSPYDLTPTHYNVNNKFTVRLALLAACYGFCDYGNQGNDEHRRYNLNLVLVDEEDRRYFKQQEIFLYRRADNQKAIDS